VDLLASGVSATNCDITKLAVGRPEAFRKAELPRVEALTEAVRARRVRAMRLIPRSGVVH
jgi:hypothetical protein